MAKRAGFDFIQETIGKSLTKFADYFSDEPFIGINNDWFSLYTSVFGSLDYHHLVVFPLLNIYGTKHPMYLDGVNDTNTFGFINADLTNEGKESHLVESGYFDIDWAPCPNGNDDYPAWDGWPVANGSLPGYPVDGVTRMFVFLKGMMLRVDSSVAVTYDKTFIFDATRMLAESLRSNDNYDIRVYRYEDAVYTFANGWVPQGGMYELNRNISGSNLIIQVGANVAQDIPNNEPRFYVIYWESPDDYCATSTPTATTPNDVTAFLTFNEGNTPLAREFFDSNRYDVINYANEGEKYFKNYYSTRYHFVDGSSEHIDDENPIFYKLPALKDSLDPLTAPYIPQIGSMWGYGYSLDQGASNPADFILQGIILCFQASAEDGVQMSVVVGPPVPPEFFPYNLNEFEWYPPVPDEYTLFAKMIVKVIASEHQVAYRPDTLVEYLEFVKSYGKSKISDDYYFMYLNSIMMSNPFLINYLDTILSPLLVPVLYMTPVSKDRISGMNYNSLYIFNTDSVFNLFNMYWKVPTQHPLVDPSTQTAVQNVHDYITQQYSSEYGQLEIHSDIARTLAQSGGKQLSTILGHFYPDDTETNFGTECFVNKKLLIPTKLELHIPILNSCNDYAELPNTKYDYSFKFKMRSVRDDFIEKDLFVSASQYYVNNYKANTLVSDGYNPEQYLWPSKLAENNTWNMYGRTVLVPDLVGGENATIEMKQFSPRNTSLPLYSEFVANLEDTYSEDLNSGDPVRVANAEEAILDAVTDQEYLYGGFDEPDTRTLDNLIYSLDEFLIGVTLYNSTGIPYWQTTIDFWGSDSVYFDSQTGASDPRYGFKVNDSWYYQSFTQTEVSDSRETYVDEHPESYYILQEQDDDTGTPNSTFRLNNSQYALSTTFTADFADVYNKIYSVKLKLKLNNLPNSDIILTVNNTDISKKPTDIIQTSDLVTYTELDEDFTWIEFTFKNPATLVDGTRYALVLTTADPLSTYVGVDSSNTIDWGFASSDQHSYGITDTSSLLTAVAETGDSTLLVTDSSIYSAVPFYAKIGAEVFEVTSLNGNYLNINGILSNDYAIATPVYEVTYVAADSEVRWVYTQNGDVYSWNAIATNPSYDATYQLYRRVDDIGLVMEVPIDEWYGLDLITAKSSVDAFYIAPSSDSYYIPAIDELFFVRFYGLLPGLNPLGGFNVAKSYDFPAVNAWRASYTNLVDGFITWTSLVLSSPSTLSVFPLAIDNGGVQYLPTTHDMYITAVCKKVNGEKKVVNKLIPSGTNTPILLDTDEFIGIDLLWVDDSEFKDDPFYGYGPAETFVIRSI